MQYNIHINQLVLAEEKKLDVADCAILGYLIWLCNSKSTRVEKERRNGYTWVNYKYLIQEMPLLRIKSTSAISVRINKLVKAGFIKTTQTKDNRLFVLLKPKIDTLFFKTNSPVVSNEQGAVHEDEHYSNTSSNSVTKKSILYTPCDFSKKSKSQRENLKDLDTEENAEMKNLSLSVKIPKKKSKQAEKKEVIQKIREIHSLQIKDALKEPSSPQASFVRIVSPLVPNFNWATPEGVYEAYRKHCADMGPRLIWDLVNQHPEFPSDKQHLTQTELDVSGEHFAEIMIALMEEFKTINIGAGSLCYTAKQWQALEEMAEDRHIGVSGIQIFLKLVDFIDRRESGQLSEYERNIEKLMTKANIPPCKTPFSMRCEAKKLQAYWEDYISAKEEVNEGSTEQELESNNIT